jgi:Tfp pilus assembly protein PilF
MFTNHREGFFKMLYGSWSRRLVRLVLVPCLLLIAFSCKGDPQAKRAVHMQKGEVYVAQEKYKEAGIEFGNAIKADPKDAQAYYKLALVFLKQVEAQLPNAFVAQ